MNLKMMNRYYAIVIAVPNGLHRPVHTGLQQALLSISVWDPFWTSKVYIYLTVLCTYIIRILYQVPTVLAKN